mgnify:CR=1 FL=1
MSNLQLRVWLVDDDASIRWVLERALKNAGWDRKDSPVFIQSFEQANLKALRRMTKVRLVQLVDANDVNPDGSLDFTAPFDRPYDWTVSPDPKLRARLSNRIAPREHIRYRAPAAGIYYVQVRQSSVGLAPYQLVVAKRPPRSRT